MDNVKNVGEYNDVYYIIKFHMINRLQRTF